MSVESLNHRNASLVTLNEKHGIIHTSIFDKNIVSLNTAALYENTPETVIDNESRRLIQIHVLHQSIDNTKTILGSVTLYKSLLNPPTSQQEIVDKQDSVQELQANDKLASSIKDYLQEIHNGEATLFRFLNRNINPRFPYKDFKEAMKAGQNIHNASQAISQPESTYCKELVGQIKGFKKSNTYRLMRGPIYRTSKGLKPVEDISFTTRGLRFRPSYISGGTISTPLIGAEIAYYSGIPFEEILNDQSFAILAYWSVLWSLKSIPKIKTYLDYSTAIIPLRNQTVLDEPFMAAVDAVGKLDELQSFASFSSEFPHPTVLPTITDDKRHHFSATNLRNPVLAKTNEGYVPNNVDLRDPLTFITGPNSGGKSTLGRSIVQNQLLAQIGCPITATYATINIADYIAYQAPKYDSLHDDEGRFGTEMQRTKIIFDNISPRCLVILDELSEGTTYKEKKQISHDLLNDFQTVGSSTIITTHNHELVSEFHQQGNGQFLKVEFDGVNPTYRIIPGISTDSHAERVLYKIEFSKEDRNKQLKQRGYR